MKQKRAYRGRTTTYLHAHRAIRRPESKGLIRVTLPLALASVFAWILLLPATGAAWMWVLDLVRDPLGMAGSTTALHYVVGDRLAVILPKLDLPSELPTTNHLLANGAVCLVLVIISFLLPKKMAPTNYFLRAGAFVQGTAVAFFALKPWPFPYTAGDYLTGLTGAGMVVIGFVPLILALTHWLLDYRWYQKVGLTLAIMAYMFVMVPFKYAAHGVILHIGGLLYMPALFILFGLPVEVFAFIALFSWGMSWEQRPRRSKRIPGLVGMPAAAAMVVLLTLGAVPLADSSRHINQAPTTRTSLPAPNPANLAPSIAPTSTTHNWDIQNWVPGDLADSYAAGSMGMDFTITTSGSWSADPDDSDTFDDTGSNGDGEELVFQGSNNSLVTITVVFENEVDNLVFSIHDVDWTDEVTVTGEDDLSVAQSMTLSAPSGSPTFSHDSGAGTASGTGAGSPDSSNDGTLNVSFSGSVKTLTLTFDSDSDSRASYGALSDMTFDAEELVTGSLLTCDPENSTEGYILAASQNNGEVYQVNLEDGVATLLFTDGGLGYKVNSLAYDPDNQYVYYASNAGNSSNRTIKRYDVQTTTISTVIADVNTLGIDTGTLGVGGASATFSNGALYLGIEEGADGNDEIWRVDFDGGGSPTKAYRVYSTPGGVAVHDWGDTVMDDGIIYDFDINTGGTHYVHEINITTGSVESNAVAGIGQSGASWDGSIWTVSSSFQEYDPATNALIGSATAIGGSWPGGGAVDATGCFVAPWPVAVDDVDATDMDVPITIDVMVNDSDPDGDDLEIEAVDGTTTQGGTASINNNGTPGDTTDDFVDYTPPLGFTGVDTFTYRVTDNDEGADTATVTVTVSAAVDLTLSSSVDDSTPPVGTNVVFSLSVTEETGVNAANLIVDATLESGLAFVSSTPSQGSYNSGTGEWSVGTLSGSGTVTLNITARVDTFSPVVQAFEVKSHDLNDVDSTPGNGSTTEDDDDAETLTPTAVGGQICYVVADSGDTLLRTIRNGNAEQSIGATGTTNMEAIAYWPGTNTLYAADDGDFGTLNQSTGAFSSIGSFGTADGAEGSIHLDDADGLTFDPLTGVLWASHRRSGANEDDLLFQVDTATGAYVADAFGAGVDYLVIAAFAVTGLDQIDDIAIDAYDGTLYAINNTASADRLISINKSTGAVTDIGALGEDDVEGLSFDAYGSLFGSSGVDGASNQNSFFAVNKSTGAATLVRALTTGTDHESVGCLIDGVNTITGNVFLDVNANGTWESGTDSGTSGITVELYRDANSDGLVDGGDTLVATEDSDGSGDYTFEVASEGDFVLQIDTGDLPGDASLTTDNVEVASFTGFGNTDSANRFGYKRPIDLSLTVTVDEPSPDVDDNVVFTITLSNDGPADATAVQVTNTLPGTLTYVSDTPSQGSFDSGTGVWTVGDLAYTGSAMLAITATVDTEDAATDWAEVTAADQDDVDSTPGNNDPAEDDQDDATVTPTGGSGGGGGGLESDGRLAGTLARVLFSRRIEAAETGGVQNLPRFQFDQGGLSGKTADATNSAVLRAVVPEVGPADSYPFESSPIDLLPVTNASDVVAADFLRSRDDRRIGAVFATLTGAGSLYEHTKVVCDRLRGAELVSVRSIQAAGRPFLLSRLIHEDGSVDHAVSFVAYRVADGFVVDSRFRLDEHVTPTGAEDVVNVQIWTVSPEYTVALLEASLARLESYGPITFLNSETNPPRLPGMFVRTGHYAEGNLHLTLQNNSGVERISLTGGTLQRTELGERTTFQQSVSVPAPNEQGLSHVIVPVGSVFDAAFFVETDDGDQDVVYLADGAWSYTYDGEGADVSNFQVFADDNAAKDGTHRVERSIRMSGEVTTWAVLFRYLRANGRPIDLSAYRYVEFTAAGEGQMRVLFEKESVHTSDHFGTVIKLGDEPQTHRIWFDDLRRPDGTGRLDASDLLLISFYVIGQQGRAEAFEMEISDLRFGGAEGDPLAVAPDAHELKQNYPNPFNPTTRITFGVPEAGPVRLHVFDTLGRKVGTLADGFVEAGRHEVTFNAGHLASGVYLYRLEVGGRSLVRHMTLLR